ncbi:MAG: hypothetical protein ABIQ88_18780 [Chitinophagaceae bacterium]
MNNRLIKRISIFLTVDQQTINEYFNMHDPAPIYKRQLSHGFEEYIMTSIAAAKRYSVFRYKINCRNSRDKQFAEPLMLAVKRHFAEKKVMMEAEFEKFKRRTYILLFISLAVVMICQGTIPMVLSSEHRIHSGLSNSLDVFSWVILWRPIDKLIFHWNPYLKEIAVLQKLTDAEVIILDETN